eukprot:CAMPEP_0184494114 /NCGR_PEP_ID=MMETSP0113_2-20130426/27842_1 /TAXON_ID=91329 /ORGANISM="Norrisiella sphaerica, Strain BC52" /LENGTH=255 /DNA_ID=CAMNT_0026879699 /DNA_START=128 /DNA_END=895 /DNA_ORIENTATION=-
MLVTLAPDLPQLARTVTGVRNPSPNIVGRSQFLRKVPPIVAGGSLALADYLTTQTPKSTAGEVSPGMGELEADGFRLYKRPYGASASGGMRAISQGKGAFPPYQFRIPGGWKQKPVSVADPSGPETDTRFTSAEMGDLLVVLPPVFTFIDDEDSVDTITIDEIAPPMKLLPAFAPQALGIGIEEDGEDVSDIKVLKKKGLTYYNYEVKPHSLVSATVYQGRVYVLAVKASQSQWGRFKNDLQKIIDSFEVIQQSA